VQTESGTIDNPDTILIEGGNPTVLMGAIVTYSGALDKAALIEVTGGALATAMGGSLAVTGMVA